MPIDALPTPPTRADAASFAARADAFMLALPIFQAQINALADALNAASLAAAASAASALAAPGTSATSVTSLTIGTGARTLAVQAGKTFAVGQFVTIARTSAADNWMTGNITAYDAPSGAMTVNVQTTNGAGTFTDWTVSLSAPLRFSPATAAQIWVGTSTTAGVTPAGLLAAMAPVAVAFAGTITLSGDAFINADITLTGNLTLANPTAMKPGMSGRIRLTQDGTGSRTCAFGINWKFSRGVVPLLSTAAGAIDELVYMVNANGSISATLRPLVS